MHKLTEPCTLPNDQLQLRSQIYQIGTILGGKSLLCFCPPLYMCTSYFRPITGDNSHTRLPLLSGAWSEISVDPSPMCDMPCFCVEWYIPLTPRVTEVVSLNQSVQELQSQFQSPGLFLGSLIIDMIIYQFPSLFLRELQNYSLKHIMEAAFWRDSNHLILYI